MDADRIIPLHGIVDKNKFEALKNSMELKGWNGLVLVVLDRGNEYHAINGSHRLAAAKELEIDVPVLILNENDLYNYISDNTDYQFEDIYNQDYAIEILKNFNLEAYEIMKEEE